MKALAACVESGIWRNAESDLRKDAFAAGFPCRRRTAGLRNAEDTTITRSLHVQSCLRSRCTFVTAHSAPNNSLVDPRCRRSTTCQMTAPTPPTLRSDCFGETTELSAVRVRYPRTEALSLRASQPRPYQREERGDVAEWSSVDTEERIRQSGRKLGLERHPKRLPMSNILVSHDATVQSASIYAFRRESVSAGYRIGTSLLVPDCRN